MKKLRLLTISLRWLVALPKHNSPSELFVNLNSLSVGELLSKFVYSFQSRPIMSVNILLSGIFPSLQHHYMLPFEFVGIPFLQSSCVQPIFITGMQRLF